jgi:hypothetical protein
MGINYEVAVLVIFLIASGIGLSLGYKILEGVKKKSILLLTMWTFEAHKIRFSFWLIISALIIKPIFDFSNLLLNLSRIPSYVALITIGQDFSTNWEVFHSIFDGGFQILVFCFVYGYTVWVVPKFMGLLSFKNGGPMRPKSLEGACLVLITGSLLYDLIAPLTFSIQQLPILEHLGSDDIITNYFFGWGCAFIAIPLLLVGLSNLLRRFTVPPIYLSSDLTEQPIES